MVSRLLTAILTTILTTILLAFAVWSVVDCIERVGPVSILPDL